VGDEPEKAQAHVLDIQAVLFGHVGNVGRSDAQDDHVVVEDFVVLEVVEQGDRGALGRERHEYGGARNPDGMLLRHLGQEAPQGNDRGLGHHAQGLPSVLPGAHGRDHKHGNEDGEPAAIGHLEQVGGEVGQVEEQKDGDRGQGPNQGMLPGVAGHEEIENGGDAHGGRDGDAVGGGQAA